MSPKSRSDCKMIQMCASEGLFQSWTPPPWPMAAASLASSYAPFHLSLMAPGQSPSLRLLPRFLQAGGAGAGMWRGSRWCRGGSSQSSPERSCRPQVCIPPRGPSGHNSSGCLNSRKCAGQLGIIIPTMRLSQSKSPTSWSSHQQKHRTNPQNPVLNLE